VGSGGWKGEVRGGKIWGEGREVTQTVLKLRWLENRSFLSEFLVVQPGVTWCEYAS